MSELLVIGPDDKAAVQEIIAEANNLMAGMNFEVPTPERLGTSQRCIETTDALTRAAHDMGVLASREWHRSHALVSFAPLDKMPSEEDLILDRTWGQFDLSTFESTPFNEFFGLRREIIRYVGEKAYYQEFSAGSTTYRQVVHTPSADFPGEHLWLETKPEQIAVGDFKPGEVDPDTYKAMRDELRA